MGVCVADFKGRCCNNFFYHLPLTGVIKNKVSGELVEFAGARVRTARGWCCWVGGCVCMLGRRAQRQRGGGVH
jgi:hypothetical protein